MNIQQFFNRTEQGIQVSRQQGSDFAKQIAGDFNPLHNADAKRFVVPGDLLFSLLLSEFGAAQSMSFNFAGMVNDEMTLSLMSDEQSLRVVADDKVMTSAEVKGSKTTDSAFVSRLIEAYVSFSGQTYPHILVPVMRSAGVMINPARPMVMYQNMSIELNEFADGELTLVESKHQFDVNGKRGDMHLNFELQVNGQTIGHGSKHMLLSGLREFDEAGIGSLTADYDQAKVDFELAVA